MNRIVEADFLTPSVEGPDGRPRILVVFLTGLVTRAEADSGYRIQNHRVVAKPIGISALITAIEQNLPACAAA